MDKINFDDKGIFVILNKEITGYMVWQNTDYYLVEELKRNTKFLDPTNEKYLLVFNQPWLAYTYCQKNDVSNTADGVFKIKNQDAWDLCIKTNLGLDTRKMIINRCFSEEEGHVCNLAEIDIEKMSDFKKFNESMQKLSVYPRCYCS